jgi:hypothetical protein
MNVYADAVKFTIGFTGTSAKTATLNLTTPTTHEQRPTNENQRGDST